MLWQVKKEEEKGSFDLSLSFTTTTTTTMTFALRKYWNVKLLLYCIQIFLVIIKGLRFYSSSHFFFNLIIFGLILLLNWTNHA